MGNGRLYSFRAVEAKAFRSMVDTMGGEKREIGVFKMTRNGVRKQILHATSIIPQNAVLTALEEIVYPMTHLTAHCSILEVTLPLLQGKFEISNLQDHKF